MYEQFGSLGGHNLAWLPTMNEEPLFAVGAVGELAGTVMDQAEFQNITGGARGVLGHSVKCVITAEGQNFIVLEVGDQRYLGVGGQDFLHQAPLEYSHTIAELKQYMPIEYTPQIPHTVTAISQHHLDMYVQLLNADLSKLSQQELKKWAAYLTAFNNLYTKRAVPGRLPGSNIQLTPRDVAAARGEPVQAGREGRHSLCSITTTATKYHPGPLIVENFTTDGITIKSML